MIYFLSDKISFECQSNEFNGNIYAENSIICKQSNPVSQLDFKQSNNQTKFVWLKSKLTDWPNWESHMKMWTNMTLLINEKKWENGSINPEHLSNGIIEESTQENGSGAKN